MILLIGISSTSVLRAASLDANSELYKDVPEGHWARDAIIFLTELSKERNQSFSEIMHTLTLEIRERLQNDEDYRIHYIEDFREICKNDENMMKGMLERLGIEYQPEPRDVGEGE